MLSKDKQLCQELLSHPGWDLFKNLLMTDQVVEGNKVLRQSLKSKLQADLLAAGRDGDGLKAAKATAQIDIIKVILETPERYLKG